jgi:hypothetical protein
MIEQWRVADIICKQDDKRNKKPTFFYILYFDMPIMKTVKL